MTGAGSGFNVGATGRGEVPRNGKDRAVTETALFSHEISCGLTVVKY